MHGSSQQASGGWQTVEGPSEKERQLGALSYVLTWLTGLIVLLVSEEDQRSARWHAIQSIGLGIALFAVYVALSMVTAFLGLFFGFGGGLMAFGLFSMLSPILFLATLGLIVYLALQAYKGETVRLPVLARFADQHA